MYVGIPSISILMKHQKNLSGSRYSFDQTMKYFVIIFIIAGFLASPFVMPESFALCVVNEDWSQAPCLDVIMNGCYDSEDVKMWMDYYDYKGESLMESKRIEMINAIEENRLQEWKSQSHENSDVWQYYHLKGEVPGISGAYYLCADQLDVKKSFTVQMNQSVFFDDYEITFSEILEDSRCPADALCVWEGRISIGIDVKNKEVIQNIILTSADKTTAYFDSYKINLVNVLPYPFSSKTILLEEYSATIIVSKTDEQIIFTPPLKQFKNNISFHDITCNADLELTQKHDGTPACVKSETVFELIKRGWTADVQSTVLSSDLEHATSSYMNKIIPTLDDFKDTLDETQDIDVIFFKFGKPHDDIGSGIHIYVYDLNDFTQVWIGYTDKILYVHHVNSDGNLLEQLLIKNEN